jgi:hypothetical protein
MAYGIAIVTGAVIGGISGGTWWKLFEAHRLQMIKVRPAEQQHSDTNETVSRSNSSKSEGRPAIPPIIDAVILVDSIGKKYVNFHVEMENLSQMNISEIGVMFKSQDASFMDVAPQMFRSMSPRDKLSTNVGLFMMKSREFNSATILITYAAEVESKVRQFTAVYKFMMGLAEAKKRAAIRPDNIYRAEGKISEEERLREELDHDLPAEHGTLMVLLPEITPDGKPNLTRFGNAKTSFLFDAQANLVLFRRLTKSGKWLETSKVMRELNQPISGFHTITMTWTNSTVSLFIDGAQKDH